MVPLVKARKLPLEERWVSWCRRRSRAAAPSPPPGAGLGRPSVLAPQNTPDFAARDALEPYFLFYPKSLVKCKYL